MRATDRIGHRVTGLLVKALLRGVTDSGDIQLVKIETLSGEVQDGIERLQPYGLTSSPPNGSEAVVGNFNGNKDHGVVLVTDSGAYRVTGLGAGEVAIYSQHGQKILLKIGGSVEITAPAGVSVGTGSGAVAMGSATDAIKTTIVTAAGAALCGSPGASCPFGVALVTALNLLPSVASTNLKAD